MNLSKLLILSGLILIIFGCFLVYQRYSPKNLAFDNLKAPVIAKNASASAKLIPVKITIPSQSLENVVFPTDIKNGKWDTTDKGVSYIASSPTPGDKGNSILYGHDWNSILGKLKNIHPGQEIDITMGNGQVRKFTVQYTSVVDPSETHILTQTEDNRLTIYTCTGFFDNKRFVAVATLNGTN